jgi:hypothetical protein
MSRRSEVGVLPGRPNQQKCHVQSRPAVGYTKLRVVEQTILIALHSMGDDPLIALRKRVSLQILRDLVHESREEHAVDPMQLRREPEAIPAFRRQCPPEVADLMAGNVEGFELRQDRRPLRPNRRELKRQRRDVRVTESLDVVESPVQGMSFSASQYPPTLR